MRNFVQKMSTPDGMPEPLLEQRTARSEHDICTVLIPAYRLCLGKCIGLKKLKNQL